MKFMARPESTVIKDHTARVAASRPRAAVAIREPRHGNPQDAVHQGEADARQQSDVRIGQVQIALHGLNQDGDQIPIVVVEHRHQPEHGEHVAWIPRTGHA